MNRSLPAGWLYKGGEALPASDGTYYGPEHGLFYAFLKNRSLYQCPLDKTNSARGSAYQLRNIKFSSYVMNGLVILRSPPDLEDMDWGTGERGFTHKASRYKATDMLLWETDELIPGYFNDGASSPGEGLSRRHAIGALIGKMGGSAEYIKYKKYFELVADPNRNDLWCYPDRVNGH